LIFVMNSLNLIPHLVAASFLVNSGRYNGSMRRPSDEGATNRPRWS
jgi:hypothetical protein